ncbi:MAG: hypothetical protein F4057_10600 [Acidobacteria bacterium]|nr:hypothetical protein [Acidobacteriota bacterium]MYI75731.1 hypothetical protein [Acidobacteriota bacterium]
MVHGRGEPAHPLLRAHRDGPQRDLRHPRRHHLGLRRGRFEGQAGRHDLRPGHGAGRGAVLELDHPDRRDRRHDDDRGGRRPGRGRRFRDRSTAAGRSWGRRLLSEPRQTKWLACGALSRPLTILGVERRLFGLAAVTAAALFNLTKTLLPALLAFVILYAAGRSLSAADPRALRVLAAARGRARRYDPGKRA